MHLAPKQDERRAVQNPLALSCPSCAGWGRGSLVCQVSVGVSAARCPCEQLKMKS